MGVCPSLPAVTVENMASTSNKIYVSDSAGDLYAIDPASQAWQLIGHMSVVMSDLAFAPDGTLYGISFTDLYRIDPATGATTQIATLGVTDANTLGITSEGVAYVGGSGQAGFYALNLGNGQTTLISDNSASYTYSAGDIVFAGNIAYVSVLDDFRKPEVAKIDLTSGKVLAVTTVDLASLYGLGQADGKYYGFSANSIYTLDPETGVTRFLYNITAASVVTGAASIFPKIQSFSSTASQASVFVDGNGTLQITIAGQTTAVTDTGNLLLKFTDTTVSAANAALIIEGYENFFNRAPTGAELGTWSNLLLSGTSASDFLKALANDPTGKANEPALIKLLYNGYFGRDPSASETTYWSGALQSGAATVATFNTILANDAGGKAYLPVSIKALYDTYVGRDPSAAEVTFWKGALQSGTYDLRQMQLVLAAQPGAQAHETAYLTQAYQTWLGTNPSVSDISYWSGQLNNAAVLPSQIRSILINDAGGQAHIAAIVSAEYSAYFGRAASTAEINVWKGLIAGGADFTTLQSALLSDSAGATAKTITSYYDSYFGRDPSFNEIGVWRGLLANGATTTTLRSALLGDAAGQAHTTAEVTSQYQTYFGRDPSQGEINTWKGLINGGATFTTLHNALVGDGGGKAHAAAEITALYQADFGRAPAAGETAYWTNAFNTGTANLDSFIDTLLTNAGSVIATVQATPGHAATTWIDIGDPLVINGFTAADHIAFSGPAFTGYNALDHAVQTGNDVLIYGSDPAHVVLLENVHLTDLTAANFINI